MPCPIIPFPQELRPRLPTIVGNVDYARLRQQLQQIDSLLRDGGVEREFVRMSLEPWLANAKDQSSAREHISFQQRSRRALRCTLLRTLLQMGYREFSCALAGHSLYQWFCLIDALDQIKVPSKSELHRFAHWLPAQTMAKLVHSLLKAAIQKPRQLGLKQALDLEEYFLDSTCLKANIHFPVDWVLLRDATRTLMKATGLIRQAGLKGRMKPPEEFVRQMNRLSMAMSQQARRSGGKKGRKRVLRQMKRLVGVVRCHARRHRQLLDAHWQQTQWTRPQAEQILRRIDGVLEQLPRAQKQAHERIIGGRKVPNEQKILSLYDEDLNVIVRGKAGAELEFGNTVLLGENRQGVILDFALFRDQAPADNHLLFESMTRVLENTGQAVGAVVTDRGFYSAANSRTLKETRTFDGLCPRNPQELKRRMKEPKFARLQRRRGQTEARIGILKHGFLGHPMRAKGFDHRELALAWGVLTHNLWMLARMRKTKKGANPRKLAA